METAFLRFAVRLLVLIAFPVVVTVTVLPQIERDHEPIVASLPHPQLGQLPQVVRRLVGPDDRLDLPARGKQIDQCHPMQCLIAGSAPQRHDEAPVLRQSRGIDRRAVGREIVLLQPQNIRQRGRRGLRRAMDDNCPPQIPACRHDRIPGSDFGLHRMECRRPVAAFDRFSVNREAHRFVAGQHCVGCDQQPGLLLRGQALGRLAQGLQARHQRLHRGQLVALRRDGENAGGIPQTGPVTVTFPPLRDERSFHRSNSKLHAVRAARPIPQDGQSPTELRERHRAGGVVRFPVPVPGDQVRPGFHPVVQLPQPAEVGSVRRRQQPGGIGRGVALPGIVAAIVSGTEYGVRIRVCAFDRGIRHVEPSRFRVDQKIQRIKA